MEKPVKDPSFKRTENQKSIRQIINDRLALKPLAVQLPSLKEKYAKIMKATDEGVVVNLPDFIPPKGAIMLAGFLDGYYIEIELTLLEVIQESFYLYKAGYLRISSQRRMDERYTINDESLVTVKKIRISKSTLEVRNNVIPVAYKVIFEKYEKSHAGLAQVVKILPFDVKSALHRHVQETGKTVYIADTRGEESFAVDENSNEDLVNLKAFYGESFGIERKKMVNKSIIGRIISPIIGPVSFNNWAAIGYIELVSPEPMDFMKLVEVKSLSFEIVEALRDTSTLEVDEKHRVLDMSKGGLAILVKNRALIEEMTHRPQFLCNIVIKGQAPITVNCWIRMKKALEDGSMKVGVKIQGESSRQDQMVRYLEFIKSLEKEAAAGKALTP